MPLSITELGAAAVRFAFGSRGSYENDVTCSRTQHNDPSQHLNLDHSIEWPYTGCKEYQFSSLPIGQAVNKS